MKVLMLQDKPVLEDNRVYREAVSLVEAGYKVTLIEPVSAIRPGRETLDGFEVERILPPEFFEFRGFRLRKQIASGIAKIYSFDVLHCHDQQMLNLGALIKKQLKNKILIYDSHELFYGYPLAISPEAGVWIKWKSKIVRWFEVIREKKNARSADYIITVNHSVAKLLTEYFKPSHSIVVLRNICCADRKPVNYQFHFRKNFSIPDGQKILVFLAMYMFRRTLDLETILEQLANKQEVCLIFICKESADKNYFMQLSNKNNWSNAHFYKFIDYDLIQPALKECDIGLVPSWNKQDLSYWLALDNKIFEYVQAGLPMLLTQQPEYLAITEEYNFGICVNPEMKDAYYQGVKEVLSKKEALASASRKAATELKWENEKNNLIGLYNDIKQRWLK